MILTESSFPFYCKSLDQYQWVKIKQDEFAEFAYYEYSENEYIGLITPGHRAYSHMKN